MVNILEGGGGEEEEESGFLSKRLGKDRWEVCYYQGNEEREKEKERNRERRDNFKATFFFSFALFLFIGRPEIKKSIVAD